MDRQKPRVYYKHVSVVDLFYKLYKLNLEIKYKVKK